MFGLAPSWSNAICSMFSTIQAIIAMSKVSLSASLYSES